MLVKLVRTIRPNKKNKCVSGYGSEILGRVGNIYLLINFFLEKKNYAFKMQKKIYFIPGNLKKFKVSPVNLGRVGLP